MGLFDIFFKRKKTKKAEKDIKFTAEHDVSTADDDREFLKDPEEMTKSPAKSVKKSEPKKEASPQGSGVSTVRKSATQKPKVEESKQTSAKKSTVSAKPSPSKETKKVEESAETVHASKHVRSGKFEIKKSKDGRFVFNLYASNNVIVATSQVYSSASSAMVGIKSIIANAGTAPIEDQTLKNFTSLTYPKWEIYLDKGNQYRFRLCASNGSCVCHSQGYTAKANCKKGIESIIKFASDAEISKAYLEKSDT